MEVRYKIGVSDYIKPPFDIERKAFSKEIEFLELKWNDSVLKFQETAKKRTQIKTPSYDQVIKPIYSEASGRWKIYQKQIENIYPILEPWIKKFNY